MPSSLSEKGIGSDRGFLLAGLKFWCTLATPIRAFNPETQFPLFF
jgi:hypothetical protein